MGENLANWIKQYENKKGGIQNEAL